MTASDQIARVLYSDGQYLRAVDFSDEQQYEDDARRRHVLAHHTWGIVSGLELEEVPIQGSTYYDVVLHPGVAIDAFGRELVNFHKLRLDPSAFAAFNTVAHQTVWLAYTETDGGALSSDWSDCQDSQPTRTIEGWSIVVSPPDPVDDSITVDGTAAMTESTAAAATTPPPSTTPLIPDDQSVAYQALPETPVPGGSGPTSLARWPVRLGTVLWDGVAQQFGTAGDLLMQDRVYVGVVASSVLAPADTLTLSPRVTVTPDDPTPDPDSADFATVEGRLRVEGRIDADADLWINGGAIHFAFAKEEEDSVPLTLGREQPAGGAAGTVLRLQLGATADAGNSFVIGPGDTPQKTGTPSDILRVDGDDVVEIPTGKLSFDDSTRQMIDLYATATDEYYGIGVQSDSGAVVDGSGSPTALYFRSAEAFRWHKRGTHDDTGQNGGAGASGQLQLELDTDANLQFGSTTRQMLNLYDQKYGIGVQSWTLYFRSDGDFCWYRGGAHSDTRDDAGGGATAMRLDDSSNLWLSGSLEFGGRLGQLIDLYLQDYGIGIQTATLYTRSGGEFCWYQGGTHSDNQADPGGGATQMRLDTGGNLFLAGGLEVPGDVSSVIQARTYERAVMNTGTGPTQTPIYVGADFTEISIAFAALGGYSIFNNSGDVTFHTYDNVGGVANTSSIPQHSYARVSETSGLTVTVESFCQESDPVQETDNTVLFTLVVIGRNVT